MALLNPPQTLPHIAFVVYRYLLRYAERQEESLESLLDLLAPASLQQWQGGRGQTPDDDTSHQQVVRFGLDALRDLEIVERDGDVVRLHPTLPESARDPRRGEAEFRGLLRARILDVERNRDLWATDRGPRDLTRALAWVLAQSVFTPLRPWEDPSEFGVQRLQLRQLGTDTDRWVFLNDTRWPPFTRWAPYLGFGWWLALPRPGMAAQRLFVPDPTVALRDSLAPLFGPSEKMALPPFLTALATLLPVVDGGTFRRSVQQQIDPRVLPPPDEGALSSPLAHALLRLNEEGVIELTNESDTDKRLFPRETGEPLPYSHILWRSADERRGR